MTLDISSVLHNKIWTSVDKLNVRSTDTLRTITVGVLDVAAHGRNNGGQRTYHHEPEWVMLVQSGDVERFKLWTRT